MRWISLLVFLLMPWFIYLIGGNPTAIIQAWPGIVLLYLPMSLLPIFGGWVNRIDEERGFPFFRWAYWRGTYVWPEPRTKPCPHCNGTGYVAALGLCQSSDALCGRRYPHPKGRDCIGWKREA